MRRVAPLLLAGLAVGLLAGCAATTPPAGTVPSVAPAAPVDLDRPLTAAEAAWVEETLAGLDLAEKAAQMVFVRLVGWPAHRASEPWLEVVSQVRDLGAGGLVVSTSEVGSLPALLDALQEVAEVPLLVSADLERGVAFRARRGTVPLPWAMAVGATGSAEWARFTGEVTAREARAVGIHWALAPVVDVNNDPANPVINIRSYGEDPARVGELAAAFVRGAREGGVLTTAKHFPGHGDTAVDSHLERPILDVDRARLETVEWPPFRATIAAGVDAVMTAHVSVPAIDPSGAAATLSPILSQGILRDEMGFDGLIVTDAIEMSGIEPAWTGEAVVKAVVAGADVLLLPADPRVAVQSLVRGVEEGLLDEARLDASVRRLLVHKARLGLADNRRVDPEGHHLLARPEDVARAEALARAAVTVVRNEGGVLPLAAEGDLDLLHLVLASDFPPRDVHGWAEEELADRQVATTTHVLGPDVSPATADALVAAAADHTHVLATIHARVSSGKGTVDMDTSHARLVARLAASGTPVVAVSHGSPYLLAQIPEVGVYVATYGAVESSQRAAIAALFGEYDVAGKLPVALPGLYPAGHGLEIPARDTALRPVSPAAAGLRAQGLAAVGGLLADFVADGAFPGAVVAVGRDRGLAYLEAVGHLSAAREQPTSVDTIYDVASLTKVVVTTTLAMILVDEERLDLDKPVADYLPGFVGPGKEAVTVRHLLTHSSGIDWWAPLHQELTGRRAYRERIQAMDLVYPPGSETKYSDLGIILLGEILERVAGEPLEVLARERIFEPLGMVDTTYLPDAASRPRIAPTEVVAERGGLVHGEVHDENAHAMGGVAPHAGLFSTAPDLARFAQMILDGGTYGGRRIVSRRTVEDFTRPAGLVAGSTRGLGWDTKSASGSSAGTLFSPRSFGHTGFTGTSLWIDPDRRLFLVLLTNRVHPTRENLRIREVRPAIADAVIAALADPTLPPPPVAARVRTGLDRLAAGQVGLIPGGLAGRRVGLLAHAASRTADGRPALDVLRTAGADVVRLFAPEHGLAGRAAAGEAVADGRDAASGLPVISLYGAGAGSEPGPRVADLADLDLLVVDLQDAGVRFYTYVSTLLHALDAAAEAGVEIVVLDRPNPLGGERIGGPSAASRDVVAESLVNTAPGPLIHGLTLGEMARYVNARRDTPARLVVVPMAGWRRAMTWADTGLPWIPPSPNLRTPDAALAYPGTALLEATNVAEGRGTDAPFLHLCAPWLAPEPWEVAGYRLVPDTFRPLASPAAPHPKHEAESCPGWRVEIVDPTTADPWHLGVALLHRLAPHPDFRLLDDGAHLTRLLGTPALTTALAVGLDVDALLALDREDQARWHRERQAALLYRE